MKCDINERTFISSIRLKISHQLCYTPIPPTVASQEGRARAVSLMESWLHHSLDFKLLFTTLSGTNGRVSVDTLTQCLSDGNSALPKGCLAYWKALASEDGTITQEGFMRGFQEALRADTAKLMSSSREKLSVKNGLCTTAELEAVLLQCNQHKLTSALTRSRRDFYASQKSVDALAGSRKEGDGQPSTSSSSSSQTIKKHVTSNSDRPSKPDKQPVNEKLVLAQVKQMLRSRRIEDTYVSDVMDQLGSMLKLPTEQQQRLLAEQQQQRLQVVPTSHPYATIRRSRSMKQEKPDRFASEVNSRSLQGLSQMEYQGPVKLNRSTSFPGKKSEQRNGRDPSQQDNPVPIVSKSESKSMHNIPTGTKADTRERLHAWVDIKRAESPKKGGPRRANSQNVYQQHPFPPAAQQQKSHKQLFYSTPDMAYTDKYMTPEEMKLAEQYGTLRTRNSRRKDPPTKHECKKTAKSEYLAEIHRLRREKEALIKHIFKQQAFSNDRDDSLMSVL